MNTTEPKDDIVVASLKKRYFDVISKEDYPRTPKFTEEADNIETAVRDLQKKKAT